MSFKPEFSKYQVPGPVSVQFSNFTNKVRFHLQIFKIKIIFSAEFILKSRNKGMYFVSNKYVKHMQKPSYVISMTEMKQNQYW